MTGALVAIGVGLAAYLAIGYLCALAVAYLRKPDAAGHYAELRPTRDYLAAWPLLFVALAVFILSSAYRKLDESVQRVAFRDRGQGSLGRTKKRRWF